ncbi:MAG: MmgE/PrpD family protein [Acidimicrobiia bacterium]
MSGIDTPLTMELAEWAASTGTDDIPEPVAHQVRRSLVDYLTAAILGASAEPAVIVRDYLAAHDSDGSSTVIGVPLRLSPAGAAAANGTAAHALDLDDGYTPGACHPGGPILSAALAAGEAMRSDALSLVRAIALGYEVACRIAGASHPAQRRRGFHNTALVGVFGAATAVAALRGLDAVGFANAYGLAGSHAGGLLSFLDQGSDVKRYHTGKAARDGLVCADLAARGLTAPTVVLEGAHGYFHAFTGDQVDVDHLTGDLGTTWRMLRTYNKPYPCCRHVHGAIDAALQIREREHLEPESIESVRVETFAIAASHDGKDIDNLLDAQMSLPYSVAAALVHGEVGMEQFDAPTRADARIRAIIETTEVLTDDAYTADYPASRAARVHIRANGGEHVAEVMQPYGEPDNPMSDDAIDHKFRRLAGPILGSPHSERILEAAWSLDDSARLFEALSAAGRVPTA